MTMLSLSLSDDAIFDCLRARHDAIDATISYFAKELDVATSAFDGHIIKTEFPQFLELNDWVIAIQEKIQKSRRDRINRDFTYIKTANEEFEKCCKLFRDFKTSIMPIRPLEMRSRKAFLVKNIFGSSFQ